jgi:hypothetical protein
MAGEAYGLGPHRAERDVTKTREKKSHAGIFIDCGEALIIPSSSWSI